MRLFNILNISSQNIFLRIFKSLYFRLKNKKESLYKNFGIIRILFFYKKNLPLNIRLNFIEPIDLKYVSDFKLAKISNLKNKKELGKIFCDLAKKKLNISKNIVKASWCLASQTNSKASVEYLIKTIESLNLDYQTISYLFSYAVAPFFYYGAIKTGEYLQIYLRKLYDKSLNISPSLNNEILHFTGIGHLSLAFFLTQAIKCKLVNPSKTPISMVYDSENISNNEYADLVAEMCLKSGIKIVKPSKIKNLNFESNLELWPINSEKKYLTARHYYGFVYEKSQESKGQVFLKPKDYHIEKAKSLIKKFSIKIDKWFVGMHLRYAQDDRSLRNPSTILYEQAIKYINNNGGSVILVGSKSNEIYNKLISAIDTTKLPLNKFERECLGIYIWSKSKFFIGSLSGGTNPATTFGVPTIWLDIFPNCCFRPPNQEDICLPKRVFYIPENRYLSFEEADHEDHYFSQNENKETALKYGYRIDSVSNDLVEEVLKKMIHKTVFKKNIKLNIPYIENNSSSLKFGAKIITKPFLKD